MTNREPAELTAFSPVAAELARSHHVDCLRRSLVERLFLDGRKSTADFVQSRWDPSGLCGGEAWRIAGALVTRLRIDGAGQLADALASLMSQAGVAPVFSDPVVLDELELHENATLALKVLLLDRLYLDGHPDIATAITELFVSDARSRYSSSGSDHATMAPARRHALSLGSSIGPLTDDARAHHRSLAAAHDARTLLEALLARLHGDGREAMAGYVMWDWLHSVTGPLVDPRKLAKALVGRLREPPSLPPHLVGLLHNDPNHELADAIEDLLRDVPIDRDPADLWRSWLDEVAGPLLKARPLAAALVDALRLPGHAEHPWLADAVLSLMQSAEPPILPLGTPPPGEAR